jgi:glycosyltransferase involved in cell wall biosynthesis
VTDTPVFLIPEGVDLSYFHPAPPSGLFSEELFLVFSGGKVEFRKGQDIVLKAFKAFSEGKSNVRLVTAWQTNFKGVGSGFQGLLDTPLTEGERGLDVRRWGADNGINPELIVNLGALRQADVALILREMDCAVQVSRCEGGTNFVAMEAMASGVPTILSAVAGHLDIVDYPNAIPVRPGPSVVAIEGCGTDGWGEAPVDDVAHELERLYVQKMTSGRAARRLDLFPRTWAQHADELAALLRRIDPSLP